MHNADLHCIHDAMQLTFLDGGLSDAAKAAETAVAVAASPPAPSSAAAVTSAGLKLVRGAAVASWALTASAEL